MMGACCTHNWVAWHTKATGRGAIEVPRKRLKISEFLGFDCDVRIKLDEEPKLLIRTFAAAIENAVVVPFMHL